MRETVVKCTSWKSRICAWLNCSRLKRSFIYNNENPPESPELRRYSDTNCLVFIISNSLPQCYISHQFPAPKDIVFYFHPQNLQLNLQQPSVLSWSGQLHHHRAEKQVLRPWAIELASSHNITTAAIVSVYAAPTSRAQALLSLLVVSSFCAHSLRGVLFV